MELFSSAFKHNDFIPRKYTCDGNDVSPPLTWEDSPDNTISFALICDDPDAPMGTWVHWVLFNLPPDTRLLPENLPEDRKLPDGSIHGMTDFRRPGYGGPCPPRGTHRYFFKLYALDKMLDLEPGATKSDLVKAMQGHILAQCELMGKYGR
ncbi:MAG: phosphatidylethanolamine-binding protein [Bacteroides sp. SM23_62_1]|nr:MAG: phosphatidylethanolamine-binding protein [Bacteroides sp. SM23_62_1]